MFGGRRADAVQMPGFDLHGLRQVVGVEIFLDRGIETRAIGQLQPEWVAGQQRFAEVTRRQRCAAARPM